MDAEERAALRIQYTAAQQLLERLINDKARASRRRDLAELATLWSRIGSQQRHVAELGRRLFDPSSAD
jgi:hypothetical protein